MLGCGRPDRTRTPAQQNIALFIRARRAQRPRRDRGPAGADIAVSGTTGRGRGRPSVATTVDPRQRVAVVAVRRDGRVAGKRAGRVSRLAKCRRPARLPACPSDRPSDATCPATGRVAARPVRGIPWNWVRNLLLNDPRSNSFTPATRLRAHFVSWRHISATKKRRGSSRGPGPVVRPRPANGD